MEALNPCICGVSGVLLTQGLLSNERRVKTVIQGLSSMAALLHILLKSQIYKWSNIRCSVSWGSQSIILTHDFALVRLTAKALSTMSTVGCWGGVCICLSWKLLVRQFLNALGKSASVIYQTSHLKSE